MLQSARYPRHDLLRNRQNHIVWSLSHWGVRIPWLQSKNSLQKSCTFLQTKRYIRLERVKVDWRLRSLQHASCTVRNIRLKQPSHRKGTLSRSAVPTPLAVSSTYCNMVHEKCWSEDGSHSFFAFPTWMLWQPNKKTRMRAWGLLDPEPGERHVGRWMQNYDSCGNFRIGFVL